MPTIPSIRTSVENQSILIRDEHARNGRFLRDARNRLYTFSGGFTVVYPYVANNEKWAFRCWHANMGNVRERYEIISRAIISSKTNYLCNFVYVNEGIVVDGYVYPTTRMEWVDGMTLKNYICTYRGSKAKLARLAENFLRMVQDMHRRKFAHGDLQHGNIIVSDKEELYLVDYDSFYCPELRGSVDIIHGLPDYQHPLRKSNRLVSEKLDYFSELIIYLSILGIAEKPSLIDKYKVADTEHLLFTADDFTQFPKTAIYKDLHGLSNLIDKLLSILTNYLKKKDINSLEPFYKHLFVSPSSQQESMILRTKKITTSTQLNKATIKSKTPVYDMLDANKIVRIAQIINSLCHFKYTHYTEEYRQLQELENSHMNFKGIPITGSVEQITNQFLKIGDFKCTKKYGANLCGTLFGLPTVYVHFVYSNKYENVSEIAFSIYEGELKLIYDAFKETLQTKYASATISVSSDIKNPYVFVYPGKGYIYLSKHINHVSISYVDDLKIYDEIKKIKEDLWIKQKVAREQRLKNRLMARINIDI